MTFTTNLWNKTPDGFQLQEKVLGDTFSPSMVARGRASNVTLTSVMEKTIAFLPPSVGFRASSIAADYGATYVDVQDVQIKTHEGRYYDKLSALMADQPDGVEEVHVARLAVTAKTIQPGLLTEKVNRTSAMVPYTVARERSDNPVLVWNDQYDRSQYPGITARALKSAMNGDATALNFKEGASPREDEGASDSSNDGATDRHDMDYRVQVAVADIFFDIPTTQATYEHVLNTMERQSRERASKGLSEYTIEVETGTSMYGDDWTTLRVEEA